MAAAVIDEKILYSRDDAAQLLAVSTKTLDEAIRAGRLGAVRIGRRVLIPRAALLSFAQHGLAHAGETTRRAPNTLTEGGNKTDAC
jgi:excisionase family DNA binding protein